MMDCSIESELLIIQIYACLSTKYSGFVSALFFWPDNLSFWQCVGVQRWEISIISVTIICLCTTFKPVKVNPNVVIDAWSAASLKTICSFCQNYTCHLLSGDMPLKLTVVLFPRVNCLLCHFHMTLQPLSSQLIILLLKIRFKKILIEKHLGLSVIWCMAS